MAEIKNICVVGAGNMGHQIALNAALGGFNTVCADLSQEALVKAKSFVDKYLPDRVAKGKMSQQEAETAKAGLIFTSDLAAACRNADLVIEAVVEKLEVKRQLFAELDKLCPPRTILATNSSFIVSSRIADVTGRVEKVCNMHYFNPALVMTVVEVVKGPHTSAETVQMVVEVCRKLQKTPVVVKKEVYGFVVNRIMSAINYAALDILEQEIASPEDIDIAVEGALGHPMGPFRLMDLTGIDLIYDIAAARYEETKDPLYAPPRIIKEKYEKGEYGKKTGKGFYQY
jgi:3-hydroxybutyryl-CoA dehydrogenase